VTLNGWFRLQAALKYATFSVRGGGPITFGRASAKHRRPENKEHRQSAAEGSSFHGTACICCLCGAAFQAVPNSITKLQKIQTILEIIFFLFR
jgi:hypothetical protein